MDTNAYDGADGAYAEAVDEADSFGALRAAIDEFGGIVGDKGMDTVDGLKEQVTAAEDLVAGRDVDAEAYDDRFARAVASSESTMYIPTTHGIRGKVEELVESEGYQVDDSHRIVADERAATLE